MARVLIIGAGGVGQVVAHKCAQLPEVFEAICLASRNEEKCKKIAAQIKRKIETAQVDADHVGQTVSLINKFKPDVVINVALPYQDLTIMEACLKTGVHYVDTANYEPPHEAKFCYKWQWDLQNQFKEKGILALLGSGFDPGVTNVFTAYAQKHYFDEIYSMEIIDCNAGDHGKTFATNFNPEINIREITAKGKYWENGSWKEIEPLSVSKDFEFPEGIGPKKIFLLYHEELESLAKNFPKLKSIKFWMTFSDKYINALNLLQDLGLTRIDPVLFEGKEIVPLKFLKAMLPDPASLGQSTRGRTCIGNIIEGVKNGKSKKIYIYNICNHEVCYKEVQSQAISYTTGVPAMIGAKMVVTGKWSGKGVFNMEEFDPDPFMDDLNKYGLPWVVKEL